MTTVDEDAIRVAKDVLKDEWMFSPAEWKRDDICILAKAVISLTASLKEADAALASMVRLAQAGGANLERDYQEHFETIITSSTRHEAAHAREAARKERKHEYLTGEVARRSRLPLCRS